MNTSTLAFDQMTATLAEQDARHAALVIALAKYRGAFYDREMRDSFLEGVYPPVATQVKAATAAMDTSSGLAPTRPMIRALLAAVDRISVLGQLGAVKVPSLNASGAESTVEARAYWVGENIPKPVSALAFAALSLVARKVVAQTVLASELLRLGTDTLNLLERAVTSAAAAALDTALLDPANAGTPNVKPASLTNGLTPLTAGADFADSVGKVLGAISGGAPTRPVLIANLQSALRLSATPGIRDYVRVLVSPAAGDQLIAVDADGVAYVDDGGDLQIGQPDIEMRDDPTNPATAAVVMVSAWQRNLVVAKFERFTNWAKRADAVAILSLS